MVQPNSFFNLTGQTRKRSEKDRCIKETTDNGVEIQKKRKPAAIRIICLDLGQRICVCVCVCVCEGGGGRDLLS